jgi:hypothetical protein
MAVHNNTLYVLTLLVFSRTLGEGRGGIERDLTLSQLMLYIYMELLVKPDI